MHALAGLWWDAKGDWTRAHESAQQDESRDGSWVHAYLHRKEGDSGQRSVLVQSGERTCLPRITRSGMAQHREGAAEVKRLVRGTRNRRSLSFSLECLSTLSLYQTPATSECAGAQLKG